jgi:hypothetical protein
MKNLILISIIAATPLVLGAVGYFVYLDAQRIQLGDQEAIDSSNNSKSINDLIKHFASYDLAIGEKQEKIAAFIGAFDGTGLVIDGEAIEFYKYDVDIPFQKELFEKYTTEGIDMLGDKIVLIRNGSFVLLPEEEHPKWKQILEAFNEF